MSAPRWARDLLTRLAEAHRVDEVVGDLEEAHRRHLDRRGRIVAAILTALETIDMAMALVWQRRRARKGSPDRGQEASLHRASRRLPTISILDLKLGVRVLVKYPGLSVVSIVGMTVAVAIGASSFTVIRGVTSSPLPLDEGDRLVTIQNISETGFDQARSTHLHDLETWREEVVALEELGAYRTVTRNLVTTDGGVVPARIVEMTASGFRIARVPPLIGRYLVDADERAGASAVVVIGYGVWQDRFGGDPDIVGRSIHVGARRHTIVGVMPSGFAFPINNRVWVPLRLDPSDFEVGDAPPIDVFGRLASDATIGEASAQFAVIGQRAANARPDTHGQLRPRVFPYTQELVWGPAAWMLYLVQLLVSLVLVVIAINVAALVYARTMTRAGEIAVRTALGASRSRIASQLFAEALILSSSAVVFGLIIAQFGVRRIELFLRSSGGEQTPFWWDFSLSSGTIAYGVVLAVLAAMVIGVVPALGATGRHLRVRLQSVGSGAAGPKLGWTWTALIVTQVAVAVAILPTALTGVRLWAGSGLPGEGFPVNEVLVTRIELDQETRPGSEADDAESARKNRYAILRDELMRRFRAHPEISHLAVIGVAPWEDPDVPFEVDGASVAPLEGTPSSTQSASTGHMVGRSSVGPGFFAALDIPILAGRSFDAGDASPESSVMIVNRTFVELVLGDRNALGRRVRFLPRGDPTLETSAEAPWHTIIGVAADFPPATLSIQEATAYLPKSIAEADPLGLAIRVRGGDPGRLAGQLREIAADIDPMLRLTGLAPLDLVLVRGHTLTQIFIVTVAALALSVLLLAVAGLYALMSFTVAQRHREIGIRCALGARSHHILAGMLVRAAGQLSLGIVVGVALALVVDRLTGGATLGGRAVLVLAAVAGLMATVGILAAWAPVRRGLLIQPTEALRAE